jgi:aspartyl-tRNA(Asn)/glutamyl-tRNA(Gln) amidotransferase subunit A
MNALINLPFSTVGELMQRKEVSPVDYMQQTLDRIEQLNPTLKAFVQVSADAAMDQARQAESEILAGQYRGPLHGVPYALKDLIDYAGVPTTANSRVLQNNIPTAHSHVSEKLNDAGAIYVGKLVTNEFACGGAPTDALYPAPLNPWNADYITAGSSSGSAVAVAAGLIPLALGSDTNGSIRNPASRCGVVGMKPTYGRVSRRGVLPLAPSMDHVGPMTRSVRDNAVALEVMAGFDPRDPACSPAQVSTYTTGISDSVKGLRIGVMAEVFRHDPMADADHNAAFEACLDMLQEAGAELIELPLPSLDHFNVVARSLLSMEGFSMHQQWLNEVPHLYGSGAKARLLQGAFFSSADYLHAQRLRGKLAREMEAVTHGVDVIITASCYDAIPRVDDVAASKRRHMYQLQMPFNVTGQPALVIPTRVSASDGSPLSIQLAGRAFEEQVLYRVAHYLEKAWDFQGVFNQSGMTV